MVKVLMRTMFMTTSRRYIAKNIAADWQMAMTTKIFMLTAIILRHMSKDTMTEKNPLR